jgi:hypothetical protein
MRGGAPLAQIGCARIERPSEQPFDQLTAADHEALATRFGVLRRQALDELRSNGPYSEAVSPNSSVSHRLGKEDR